MAISTFDELKLSVAGWLNRSDLTDVIPDFIALAEAEIKRRVRRKKVRATLSISSETLTLPTDASDLVHIVLVSSTASRDVPLKIVGPDQLAEARARCGGVAGRPTHASVFNNQLIFAPEPDDTYTADVMYYEKLRALSATQTTNTTLTEAPDVYLYGTLKEAAPYLEDDDRIATWESRFEKAVTQLDIARDREEYGSGLRPYRLPVVFGGRP
jgi:hypothetical protein